ncbi:universal stress protein [Sulfurospirillum arcachonense]|uniref:universal stress protein n=1 Tax=Sulfurospirillum arcachonense TaxID=57666 RepID=UPI00046AA740|nr:universal stress protein [Sulfurospirillum arcachonense]
MVAKKMFFPVGGGKELEERIYGALLVSKYFNTHLEILVSQASINHLIPKGVGLSSIVLERLEDISAENMEEEINKHKVIFNQCCKELDIQINELPLEGKSTAHVSVGIGVRSTLVAQQSKFCDMVIAAAPPKGVSTATFEASVRESGKPVMVIPRKMKEFKTEAIMIAWNNSPEASRAVSEAIPLLKKAKRVHIVSSSAFTTKTLSRIKDLQSYLELHDIDTTFELVKTTLIPGEALVKNAQKGNFDLIVAGGYGHKGIKEMMLGGSAKYLLEHTTIPTLISH